MCACCDDATLLALLLLPSPCLSQAFVLGIESSRIKVVRITAGSTILDYLIIEDPAISAAPIAESSFDTSNNVDRETAAALATMSPDQQQQYFADVAAAEQQQQDSGGTGGQTANSTGGAGAGGTTTSDSTAAAAAAELLAVFEALKSSIADGSMERTTGYETLDLTASVL